MYVTSTSLRIITCQLSTRDSGALRFAYSTPSRPLSAQLLFISAVIFVPSLFLLPWIDTSHPGNLICRNVSFRR